MTWKGTTVRLLLPSWHSSRLCGRFRTRYLHSTSQFTAWANLFGPSIPSHFGIQLSHRININIFQTSWEMWAARNTSGALALLLSPEAKFVNNLQKNPRYFNSHYNIAPYLSNRVTITRYRKGDLQSIMGDTQLLLQPQIQPHKEQWIGYKNVFSAWARTSQRSVPQWQCRNQSKTSMSEDIYIRPCIWYVTWNSWSHRETRLTENSGKRIIKLAVGPLW
jgi:hypothetical protein